MAKKDVEKFKRFIVKHPEVIREVKDKKKTWKEVYSDWKVLGEDHESWTRTAPAGTGSSEKETRGKEQSVKGKRKELTVGEIVSMLGKINVSDLQKYISQFGGAVESIQQLIQHFQNNPESWPAQDREQPVPYHTYKD